MNCALRNELGSDLRSGENKTQENCTSIAEVLGSNSGPEFFLGFNFTIACVVFITAKVAFKFITYLFVMKFKINGKLIIIANHRITRF